MITPDEARAFLALARQNQFATLRVHLNDDSHLLHVKAMGAVNWENDDGVSSWPSLDAFEAELLPRPTKEQQLAWLEGVKRLPRRTLTPQQLPEGVTVRHDADGKALVFAVSKWIAPTPEQAMGRLREAGLIRPLPAGVRCDETIPDQVDGAWVIETLVGPAASGIVALDERPVADAALPFTDVPGLTRWLQDQMGAFGKPDDFVLVVGDDQYRALQRMLEAALHFPADPGGHDSLQGVQLARVRPPCFRLAQWKDTTE